MRAAGVVVDPPRLDDGPGRRQAPEQMLIQALVAQAPVQALDKAVLLRLAGGDVVPRDRTLLLSAKDGVRGQRGAVVRDDHQRLAPSRDDPVEFACDPLSRQRRVDDQRQARPRAVVDHDEDPEAASIVERVGDEVQAPALVRLLAHGSRCPRAKGPFANTPPAHRQSVLPIAPEELLVVQREALPPQQDEQTPVAEAAALAGQAAQAHP